jgi:hypothetical protein
MRTLGEGQQLKHGTYGLGVVTQSDSDRTTIDFDDFGRKLFVTSLMTVELIGEAPAVPPKRRRRKVVARKAVAAIASKS